MSVLHVLKRKNLKSASGVGVATEVRKPGGEMADCPETRAFTNCLPLLDSGLNPDEVTNKLFSASVITARDKEKINSKFARYEKVNELTAAVSTNLATNPANFHTFVGILRTVSSYANLASALEGTRLFSTS